MGVYKNTQELATNLQYKHQLIYNHLLESYYKLSKKENPNVIVKNHKKFINSLKINTKKKPVSVSILEHYRNTHDKNIAFDVLTCALNNRGLFAKM